MPSGLAMTVLGPGCASTSRPESGSSTESSPRASTSASRSSSRSRAAGEIVAPCSVPASASSDAAARRCSASRCASATSRTPVDGRVGDAGGAPAQRPVAPLAQRHRDPHRIGVPPRRRGTHPRIGLVRAEGQVARRVGAQRRGEQPVRVVVVAVVEPAREPKEVGAAGEAGAGGVEQSLRVGDQLTERLRRGGAQLLGAGTAVLGVVPGGECDPVGTARVPGRVRSACRPAGRDPAARRGLRAGGRASRSPVAAGPRRPVRAG